MNDETENTDANHEKRHHDAGGDPGGPIDIADHGMKFWEKQANGLRGSTARNKLLTLDELRRAAEDLGENYYKLAYFERTTSALRNILLERRIVTEEELTSKMKEVRGRFDVPDEMEFPLKKGAVRD